MIGELDPDEPVPANYVNLALTLLNDLINEFTGTVIQIPLTKSLEFNLTVGKSVYTFSNLVTADVVSNRIVNILYGTIYNSGIAYPLRVLTRTPVYDDVRNTQVQARPRYMLLRKDVEFSTIEFFSVPDQNYDFVLQAKFYLDKFDLFSPIANIPLNLQRFMRYALARELIAFYPSANWPQQNEDEYQRLFKEFRSSNDLDLTVRPSGLLQRRYRQYSGSISDLQGGV